MATVDGGVGDSEVAAAHAVDLDDELSQPRIGTALRALRDARGYNRADVAGGTGLSASFIALVETGRSDLSIGRLARLLRFYGVHLHDLVQRPPSQDVVIRQGEGYFQQVVASEGVSGVLLAPDFDRRMMPMLATYAPGARMVDLPTNQRESFMFVLEGELHIERTAGETLTLRSGDAIYFKNASVISALTSDTGARSLVIIDPPSL